MPISALFRIRFETLGSKLHEVQFNPSITIHVQGQRESTLADVIQQYRSLVAANQSACGSKPADSVVSRFAPHVFVNDQRVDPHATPLLAIPRGALVVCRLGDDHVLHATGKSLNLAARNNRAVPDHHAITNDHATTSSGALLRVPITFDSPYEESMSTRCDVVHGPICGQRVLLRANQNIRVGRTLSCEVAIDDPTISSVHLKITTDHEGEVRVEDHRSTNGTLIDGVMLRTAEILECHNARRVSLGKTTLEIARIQDDPAVRNVSIPTDRGTWMFNRQPRSVALESREPLAQPSIPTTPPSTSRFSISAMVVPLGIGLAMALLISPRMAMFALMSPVMMLSNMAEERMRSRRGKKTGQVDFDRQLANFERSVRAATETEIARLLSANPPLPTILAWAGQPNGPFPQLWERRPWNRDAFVVEVGLGTRRVPIDLRDSNDVHPDVEAILNQACAATEVPICVSFWPGEVVGIVGRPERREAVARAITARLTTLHGPADLQCAVFESHGPPRNNWDWMWWLPHNAPDANADAIDLPRNVHLFGGGTHTVSINDDSGVERLLSRLKLTTTLHQTPDHNVIGAHTILIVDDAAQVRSQPALRDLLHQLTEARRKREGRIRHASIDDCPANRIEYGRLPALILLADAVEQLPDCTSTIVQLDTSLETFLNSQTTAVPGKTSETERSVGGGGSGTLRADRSDLIRYLNDGAAYPLIADGISQSLAFELATNLACIEDNALIDQSSDLPSRVSLQELLPTTKDALRTQWLSAPCDQKHLIAVLGVGAAGPLTIDLVRDGPHALIAGTTGSGKSELLRTLVSSLAVTYPPQLCNFVLIDYKGGSAFAECLAFPHTVGMVTDLDSSTAQRALVCLEAELKRRERLFASVSAEDLIMYSANQENEPLPRLVVIIDEFATLAKDLPEFLVSIVDIAQRGRSLGVHLILATQRPSGAVNENIRANTNLRIALRVHDAHDSSDILGIPDAATISRRFPGRALLRMGHDDVTMFQTATVEESQQRATDREVAITLVGTPRGFASESLELVAPSVATEGSIKGSVAALVAQHEGIAQLGKRVCSVAESLNLPEQRRPWPDPLPDNLTLATVWTLDSTGEPHLLGAHTNSTKPFSIGLADLPDDQRQCIANMSLNDGNIACIGVAGSGASATLVTIAQSALNTFGPGALHVYGVDFGSGVLRELITHPHVGAIIGANETERLDRIARWLSDEIRARRQKRTRNDHANHESQKDLESYERVAENPAVCGQAVDMAEDPHLLILIDNYSALRSAHDDVSGMALLDRLHRAMNEGPSVGITFGISCDRPSGIASAIAASYATKLLFRLADPFDFAQLGLRHTDGAHLKGFRAIDVGTKREIQLARPSSPIVEVRNDGNNQEQVRAHRDQQNPRTPQRIDVLPTSISQSTFREMKKNHEPINVSLWLPFALSDETLGPIGFALGEAEHALVGGPARAGKTLTLTLLAKEAVTQGLDVHLVSTRVNRDSSHWHSANVTTHDHASEVCRAIADSNDATLLLVDDCELVDDRDGLLQDLISRRKSNVWIVAAGRPDLLRTMYGHWTSAIRRSRVGLALRPQLEVDGELWMTPLPRKVHNCVSPGRGFLVSEGTATLVQVISPEMGGAG
jgi:DNA segregation ATPase FtsK/SpoIIIE, S-DNA-T family